MKLNLNKTHSMIVSRCRTLYPNHPDFIINNVVLNTCESFKILGVLFDSKLTFVQHLRSVSSSSVAHKIGLLSKSHRIFVGIYVLRKCFSSFILPCLRVLLPCLVLFCSISHLKLLDRVVRTCKF